MNIHFCTICGDSKHQAIIATHESPWPELGKDAKMYYCAEHAQEWKEKYPNVKLVDLEIQSTIKKG